MTVLIRPDLDALPLYQQLPTTARVQLSNNETAFPPLPRVAAALTAGLADINRYPPVSPHTTATRLAEHLDVPAGSVAVGAGSATLLLQLMQAVVHGPSSIVYGWRSFEAYPILVRVSGAEARPVPLTGDLVHDLDAMLAAVTATTRMIIICNPNNPTGTALHRDALAKFLAAVPEHVVVVLDEAYREFVTDPDTPDGLELVREAAGRGNLVTLRTFSKAYGLAGLRIGYCAGPIDLIRAVTKVGVPFSVSTLAETAALISLDSADELAQRCELVRTERDRVGEALHGLGQEFLPSQGNFLWLPLADRSPAFAAHCAADGVMVRPFGTEGVRVTIGSPADNDAFLAVARTFA
ncbi:histidinol-phosphate transaminase [Lentzea sp. NPDC058450]|uniref:histidinol-phosphate transaminase n=1 Tax=Lentzea sp. NPDC058450 TaxID=3346505 RepID=UPI0036677008